MATQLNLTDNLTTLRTKFNNMVVEFNNVSSISSVTADTGIISVGGGQTNRNININGGSNIQTNVNGSSIEVNAVSNPVFDGLSVTGAVSFTSSFSTSNATIGSLTVGVSAPSQYTFPTAVGAEGQALVVNASGDLEFGLGGIGVTNFKGLTDTPSDYSTLGSRVLLLDGSPGGIANNVVTDSEFTFDTTNNTIFVANIDIGNSHSGGGTPLFISNVYTSEPTNIRDVVFQNTLSGGNSSNNFTSVFSNLGVSGSSSYQNITNRQSVMTIGSTCLDVKVDDIDMTIGSTSSRTIDSAYVRDATVTISNNMQVTGVFTGDNIEMIHSTSSQVGSDKIGSRVYMSGQMSPSLNQYGYLYQSDNNSLHPRHVGYLAEFNNSGTGFKVVSSNIEGGPNFGFSATIDNDGTSDSHGLVLDVSNGHAGNRSILVTVDSAPSSIGSPLILNDRDDNPVVGDDVWFYVKDTKLVFAYDEGSAIIRYTIIDLSDGTISNSTTAP
jgi:hypothetical protein